MPHAISRNKRFTTFVQYQLHFAISFYNYLRIFWNNLKWSQNRGLPAATIFRVEKRSENYFIWPLSWSWTYDIMDKKNSSNQFFIVQTVSLSFQLICVWLFANHLIYMELLIFLILYSQQSISDGVIDIIKAICFSLFYHALQLFVKIPVEFFSLILKM